MADALRAWVVGDTSIEARAGGVIVVDYLHTTGILLRKIAGALGAK